MTLFFINDNETDKELSKKLFSKVDDGPDYWQIQYDLDNNVLFNLTINGDA